ncbi:response regulator [Herminiimonas sp. CN]|uniref:response regulator n=1 Tax=Herminiimonas sp. CN TaxID=1349818 RepID=UPI0004738C2F|nr:response regulator [Herminiimonas sp. CN]
MKISLAEDGSMIGEAARQGLTNAGFSVDRAQDGRAADARCCAAMPASNWPPVCRTGRAARAWRCGSGSPNLLEASAVITR